MSFNTVLERYRKVAFSERDKGTRFECLMRSFLKTYPVYQTIIKEVYLWNEFPCRNQFGGKDTGIDLVVETYDDKFWAVQCKCYQETTKIDKPEVDTFLSTSGKHFKDLKGNDIAFSHRLWISTTNKWTEVAEDTLKNQIPGVQKINLTDLENAPVDWEELDKGLYGENARVEKKHYLTIKKLH
jgi:predicted helicase